MKAYMIKEINTGKYYISGTLTFTNNLGKTFQSYSAANRRKIQCEENANKIYTEHDYRFIIVSYDLLNEQIETGL